MRTTELLDLSRIHPRMDLLERIKTYKNQHLSPLLDTEGIICITGHLCKNKPLKNYVIQKTPKNGIFAEDFFDMMSVLLRELAGMLPNFIKGFTANNEFVLFFSPTDTPLRKDSVSTLFASRGSNVISKRYFENAMCLITVYQLPITEVKSILSYHRDSWRAQRNRLIASKVLHIPMGDRTYTSAELGQKLTGAHFNWGSLPTAIKRGYILHESHVA